MKIKIDEAKQSERVYRQLFPEIPSKGKSFSAFWREDKSPSSSFVRMESGTWVIKDFSSGKGYDIIEALKEFKQLTFKQSLELIGVQFPEFIIEPEKTPIEWAKRRSIPVHKLEIHNNQIEFKYFDWESGEYIGSKFRQTGENLPKDKRFISTKGLSLKDNFFHANLGQAKRLYIFGSEGDCLAFSHKVSDPCVAISGEAPRLPTKLIDCINHYKFEEIYIYYDNPLYEPEKAKSQIILAKELIKIDSVNLVFGANWKGIYFKDVGEALGADFNIVDKVERLEFKPLDEDIEVLKDEFIQLQKYNQEFNLYDYLPSEFADLFGSYANCIDANFPHEAMLSMFMSVVGGLLGVRFKVKEGYKTTKAIIWTVLSICSSSGKSEVLRFLTAPIVKREAELAADHMRETENYEQALIEWKASKKNKEGQSVAMPKLPVRKRYMIETLTVESVRRDHGNNPDGLIVSGGELAGFFNSFGQYKGGKGDDRQAWLQFHSGEAILMSRVDTTREVTLTETAISIIGAIQPHILNKILQRDADASDGLFARFLYLDYEGYKLSEEPNKEFHGNTELLLNFYNWILWMRQGKMYQFELDNSTNFKNNISISLKKAQNQAEHPTLHSYIGKQYNQWKALCLVFHMIECFQSKEIKLIIGLDVQQKAARLIKLYQDHFKKILLRNSNRGNKLTVYNKIMQLKESEIKPSRVVSSNWAKDTKEAVQLFDEMEKMGFGYKEKGKRGSFIFIKKERK